MQGKIVALLPMKGNSERVPNKNLKDFSGKPLYHRVLDTLLCSNYISTIII
ncbi:cytidylyltransferase domain-containing protein, partial [Winogradskyella sp.]